MAEKKKNGANDNGVDWRIDFPKIKKYEREQALWDELRQDWDLLSLEWFKSLEHSKHFEEFELSDKFDAAETARLMTIFNSQEEPAASLAKEIRERKSNLLSDLRTRKRLAIEVERTENLAFSKEEQKALLMDIFKVDD